MTPRIDGIINAVCASPWAIMPEKLQAIMEVLQLKAQGREFSADEVQARIADGKGTRSEVRKTGKVAVLPLYGVISQRMNAFSSISGGTSTELFGKQLQALIEDPDVSAIVLDVDSPGGRVEGVEELAARIHAARGKKPMVAVANSLMASAAYWIASAADEVVAAPGALVGSIGVFTVHTSYARAAANEGFDFTVLRAGRFKAEGLPYEPLSAEARAFTQQQIEDTYDRFTSEVGRFRGASSALVREKYGEGRALLAPRAVTAGLADRVATLDTVIAEFAGSNGGARRNSRVALSSGIAAMEPVDQPGMSATEEPPVVELLAATEGAALADPPSLEHPAPPAEENTAVEKNGTAAPDGAGPSAEQARFGAFLQLAKAHNKSTDDVSRWMSENKTVDGVRAELLDGYKDGAKPVQVRVGQERELTKPFGSLGEQLLAIRNAAMQPHSVDRRLLDMQAAATGLGEQIGSDGGFPIQNDLLALALEPMFEKGEILSRVRRIPISQGKNGAKFWVIDEESRATGSRFGGLSMRWVGEGDTAPPAKPKLRKMELELKKLLGFAYVTEEEQEDAPVMGNILEQAYRDETEFMLEDAVVNGAVNGPAGIKDANCVVSVAIEAGQTIANTPANIAKNVANMKVVVPPKIWQRGIWIANPEMEPSLITATLGGTNHPIYLPAGGLSASPYSTLLGKPVVYLEYCEALGTPGDLMFVGLSEYVMADKAGVKTAWSSHVQFLTEQQCFRISTRVDGQPLWKKSMTPAKGSVARSPFVKLAVRA